MSIEKQLTPQETVDALNNHIVGQHDAKRAVAVALRNRHRRMQLDEKLRAEITPKNILMIGPTGVGKTEIARRLAKLADAPFLKVEATKFTEIGYVGRDVDSIIRDLVDISVKMLKEKAIANVKEKALSEAHEKVLDALLPTPENASMQPDGSSPVPDSASRQLLRKKLLEGQLDDKEIEIGLSSTGVGIEIMAPPGMEEMTNQLQGMFKNLSADKKRYRKMKVKDAIKALSEEESEKLINEEDIRAEAIEKVEQSGIVFLDEIDKVTQRSDSSGRGGDVSREGVQRDLLPLLEGATVSTKYGMVKSDHILFIASGAFHLSKPSDLIPELQGRLPIRVELQALKVEDFVSILTEPKASLTAQYQALLKTEGVELEFTEDGVRRLAEISWEVNENTENIGARRLHTTIERLLDEISFKASDLKNQTITIDAEYVNKQLESLAKNEDLSRFIL